MNIYVGNLPYAMGDNELRELFAEYGTVDESKVITDRDTGRSKGFGFVEMNEDSEGEDAIRQLDGREVEGRNIKVNVARPKVDRPRRDSQY